VDHGQLAPAADERPAAGGTEVVGQGWAHVPSSRQLNEIGGKWRYFGREAVWFVDVNPTYLQSIPIMGQTT
jgi:hypothetical protein